MVAREGDPEAGGGGDAEVGGVLGGGTVQPTKELARKVRLEPTSVNTRPSPSLKVATCSPSSKLDMAFGPLVVSTIADPGKHFFNNSLPNLNPSAKAISASGMHGGHSSALVTRFFSFPFRAAFII